MLRVDANILVFGIRDADYTRYENPPRILPASVFVTDYRDIETTMLAAESVISALTEWNPGFSEALTRCLPVARHIGYLRICNYLCDLGCNFKKSVRTSVVWDQAAQVFVPNWEESLLQLFLENCAKPFSWQQWEDMIRERGLEREDDLYVCQRHDLLRLLQYTMNPNDRIRERMVTAYSQEDFYRTHLYESISTWAENRSVNIWA